VENVGGVWKGIGLLKTAIVQFEYEITNNNIYGEYRSESQIQYTLDACKESMEIYAEEHGYDFKYINKYIYDKGISLIEDAKITLNGYINFVKSQLKIYKK